MVPAALSRIGRRRSLRAGAALVVVLGLIMWWLLPLGDSAPTGSLSFSTGVRSGVYQRYGERLRGALAKDLPDVSIELQTSEGSQQNLARVATGKADFTIATTDAVATYLRDGKPGAERLRGCVRLYDDYIQLVVDRNSEIRKVSDLRGKSRGRPAGLRGTTGRGPVDHGRRPGPGRRHDGDTGRHRHRAQAPGGRQARRVLLVRGLPTTAVADLSDRFAIRLVPLEDTLIKQLQAAGGSTRYYRSAVMPADAYRNAQQGQAVPTVAVANVLVTTDRTDPAMTEAFTRTVIDSRDRIGREVHAAQLVDLRTAIYTDPLPLHEGAKRYYRSVKP